MIDKITSVCGTLAFILASQGCASTPPPAPPAEPAEDVVPQGMVRLIEYEAKTADLVKANSELETLGGNLDEQKRRLSAVCADHSDHAACSVHSDASYARAAFCGDGTFTEHVDAIVKSCHEGACKQVDEAQLLARQDYMTLVQRLPHKLVLFKNAQSKLDRKDKKQLQQFVEAMQTDKGYMIIVGRASREGPWRDNLRFALDRAEAARSYIVDQLGMPADRVGFITYGHEKMYLTELDAQRLSQKKVSLRQANRSALVFAYPCYDGK